MAEIPGIVWIVVGLFIGIFSLFTGYIKPVEYNAFFQLMMYIGIGMILFGLLKLQLKKKKNPKQQPLPQQRPAQQYPQQHQRQQYPQYYNQSKHAQQHHSQQPVQTHRHVQAQAQQAQSLSSKTAEMKCPKCGVPIMKRQKQCVMCGTKLR